MAPLKQKDFRRLLFIFLVNGIAGALPATLVPFFLRDRLQLPDEAQWTLGVYFLVGAFSTLVWVRVAARIGLIKTWMIGMALTVAAFLGVSLLQAGSLYGFLTICILTGLALGTDLALPAALLAGLINRVGDQGRREGAYFGLWNWVNKFNLAVAPALALPMLGLLGYEAASQSGSGPQNTDALLIVYAVIPCILKLLAIALLALELKRTR
jgi:Na+/melibiose symporter-like transporter